MKHSNEDDLLLYHYTNPEGLKGILESRSIWCGHASYFNDPNEIDYGMELIAGIIDEFLEINQEGEIYNFLIELKRTLGIIFKNYGYHPYMACFSESGKMLSQWRSYATGGMGYCIGIGFSNATLLADNIDNLSTDRRPKLRRVIYDLNIQREVATDYIQLVIDGSKTTFDNWANVPDDQKHTVMMMMVMQAANHLIEMILCFKLYEFRDEKEWRMVWVTREDHLAKEVDLRTDNHALTPYRPAYLFYIDENQIPIFPILSICFGPAQDESLAKKTIDILIRRSVAVEHPIGLVRDNIVLEVPGFHLRWP